MYDDESEIKVSQKLSRSTATTKHMTDSFNFVFLPIHSLKTLTCVMTPISENTHHPNITDKLLMDMITVGHKHINYSLASEVS